MGDFMSFRNRNFVFFLSFCILTIIVSGAIVIEKIHSDMIDNEISDLLNYERSITNMIDDFLIKSSISSDQDRLSYISDYFVSSYRDKLYFEIHSKNDLVMKTHYFDWNTDREDIKTARDSGRNYQLKKINNRYYILVSNDLIIDENMYVLSLIKDVSFIMISRKNQYKFFIALSIVILFLIVFALYYVTRYITKDIAELVKATSSIKSGNYDTRTNFIRNDEIGLIGNHIDEMASEIENNIIELENQALSKQRFIDNFTHELKTPLTSIIGYADILRKSKYDKDIFDKGLYHIYDEGMRLSKLSKQLNEIILLKNNELDITKENIKILIHDVAGVNEMRQYGKILSLSVDCDDIELDVDRNLLKIVLFNLIDNSIKASEDNQNIIIGATKEDELIKIFVEDQGKGISKLDLNHITEPFYIADKSRSKKEESFGLGLSICSEIIDLLGASFNIESELGQGTRTEVIFDFTTS